MTLSLRAVAESVQGEVLGDGAVNVSGIASIAQATSVDLVFVEDDVVGRGRGSMKSRKMFISILQTGKRISVNTARSSRSKSVFLAVAVTGIDCCSLVDRACEQNGLSPTVSSPICDARIINIEYTQTKCKDYETGV